MLLKNSALLSGAFLASSAVAQFPPKPEDVKTVKSKFHHGIEISYKEVDVCTFRTQRRCLVSCHLARWCTLLRSETDLIFSPLFAKRPKAFAVSPDMFICHLIALTRLMRVRIIPSIRQSKIELVTFMLDADVIQLLLVLRISQGPPQGSFVHLAQWWTWRKLHDGRTLRERPLFCQ